MARQHASTSCVNGRVTISKGTERALFARAGGYCQRPECCRDLFVEVGERVVTVAELAHVIGASPRGPRGESVLPPGDRSQLDNIILLCASCHTLVDKAQDSFPASRLLEWKRDHEARIRQLFEIQRFDSREQARKAVVPLLDANHEIFVRYGPMAHSDHVAEDDIAASWHRKVLSMILPNNRAVMVLLDHNRHLLTEPEIATVELFRQHVDDLEARHVHGVVEPQSQLFPEAMDRLLGAKQ